MKNITQSIYFLHVEELRSICQKLQLIAKDKKLELIHRILAFIEKGEKVESIKIPQISCAQRGHKPLINIDNLMLKGAYKNDLQTRLFFKSIIGNHFHYTAWGIDWLNHRWYQGLPPTYREFAAMWSEEFKRRQEHPIPPKAEWAYINFVQNYLQNTPTATRNDIINAWNQERLHHKQIVDNFLLSLTRSS